ncbi:MAG: helix-turn-helix domain-containing protein [Haloferacaceae archaeon]
MSEDCTLADVAALLADETTQAILTELSTEPMSANTLSRRCDASEPTVYRRLEELRRCDLLEEWTRPDPESGHHHTMYATNLNRVVVDLESDGFTYRVDRRENMADRFTRLIEGI